MGASVQSITGRGGVRISGSNAGYTMFQGSANCTGYPIHLPVSPSLPLPCITVCHHISTGLYKHYKTLTHLHKINTNRWFSAVCNATHISTLVCRDNCESYKLLWKIKAVRNKQDVRFTKQCRWSRVMWCCVAGRMVHDILKDCNAFFFRVKQLLLGWLTVKMGGTMIRWNTEN